MQTDLIKLNVPADIATAFREATPEAQAKASEKAWEVLRLDSFINFIRGVAQFIAPDETITD
jgi:hypothetical protein